MSDTSKATKSTTAIILSMAALIVIAVVVSWYEARDPCLEYGPEKMRYIQQVGSMMVPVYGRDCISRKTND